LSGFPVGQKILIQRKMMKAVSLFSSLLLLGQRSLFQFFYWTKKFNSKKNDDSFFVFFMALFARTKKPFSVFLSFVFHWRGSF